MLDLTPATLVTDVPLGVANAPAVRLGVAGSGDHAWRGLVSLKRLNPINRPGDNTRLLKIMANATLLLTAITGGSGLAIHFQWMA